MIEPCVMQLHPSIKKYLDTLSAEARLQLIADFTYDWDGYRTTNGLGYLLNQIGAYAGYPVKAHLATAADFTHEVVDVDGYRPVFWEPRDKEYYHPCWATCCEGSLLHRQDGRYWIGKPTKKQMDETPWEDLNNDEF